MSKSRIPTWVSLILLGVGLLAVGIPGLFVYMSVTATKVHPDSQNIPSLTNSPPLPKWAGAAEQSRQIVRASMSENNLAGLSVAVGIDGEIVWAEGFGFADIESSLPVTPNHRFRTGTASIVFTSAAIGLLLDEGRLKLDDEIQTLRSGVSGEAVACHHPSGDGGCGRPQDGRPRRRRPDFQPLRASGGRGGAFCEGTIAVSAGHRISRFDVWLGAFERRRGGCRGHTVCDVSQRKNISSARHAGHFQGIGDEPTA